MAELSDQRARDRIRHAFDTSLFVEAGAGTGKTTELVHRICGIVESGRAPLTAIVAITFTEAAAGELRERVRLQLEARVVGASGEVADRLAAAIRQVDDAPMQTIHGFANRLLQMYPTAVGLPPVFTVLDSTESSLAFDVEWRATARRLFVTEQGAETGDERLLHLAWMLGANLRHLRQLARLFHEYAYKSFPIASTSDELVWLPSVDDLIDKADEIVALGRHCSADDDRMVRLIDSNLLPWRGALARARALDDEFVAVDVLRRGFGISKKAGVAKNWSGMLDEVRERLVALDDLRLTVLDTPRQWALRGLAARMAELARASQRKRIRDGALEFNDLLVLADRLVEDGEVRADLQRRFPFVFVDEFQDTDPIQAHLVRTLASGPSGGDRLFTVGDPKQSIYRFRNADLDQYLKMRDASEEANVAELTTNFRTLPSILQWIDEVFEPLMKAALGSWSPLGHGRPDSHGGSVHVFGEQADGDSNSATVRERETVELAERLRSARDDRWPVQGSDGIRPIRFGDMAVLIPTRRSLANLERAFRHADIPYRVESRSLIWSTQEVRDVVAILRVIDDAHNENAVVAALRSPAFGCSDRELLEWRSGGGGWGPDASADAWDGDGDGDHPVGDALRMLAGLRDRARFLDVPSIVDLVIEERRIFHAAFGHARQREPWNRLRFLVDQAQGWFDEGGASLHDFLRWVEENEERQATVVESIVPESDDDAVRIMTIHAAKGLEFPLAAVVGLGSVATMSDSVRMVWPSSVDEGAPEIRIGDAKQMWQTAGFAEAAREDSEQEEREKVRLLYVAVTRARDHLLVGLHRSVRSQKSLAALLAEAVRNVEAPSIVQVMAADPQSDHSYPFESAELVEQQLLDWAARRRLALESANRNTSFSASRVAALLSDANGVLPVRTAGHGVDVDDLGYKLSFGSAVHKVLEIVDFGASAAAVDAAVKSVAPAFDLSGSEVPMAQAVAKALGSAPVREAAESGRSWREVTVSKEVDGLILRGSIDLLYERGGELFVVDYKTESVSAVDSLDHAVERYRPQLATYAAALEQDGVGVVAEVVLLFVPAGVEAATVVRIPAKEVTDDLHREFERLR